MSSFQSLWEAVTRSSVSKENRAVDTYLKHDDSFWKTLMQLSNHNPEGLADILGINPANVALWHRKIAEVSQQAGRIKEEKIKGKMLPTGL